MELYTIGHSTRKKDEFIEILKAHSIQLLIDVRTMKIFLKRNGISYVHMKELGGLRHITKDSVNTGWKNASFRGYADYMQTEEFSRAIDALIELAKGKTAAIMCAEAVPRIS